MEFDHEQAGFASIDPSDPTLSKSDLICSPIPPADKSQSQHKLATCVSQDEDDDQLSKQDAGSISAQMNSLLDLERLDIKEPNSTQDQLALCRLNSTLELLIRDHSDQAILTLRSLADLCRDGVYITTGSVC